MEPIKFIHMADLHLGKKQYNLQQRYEDYFNVFKWILDFAINEEVDFILIAGDIFDSKKIGPVVLSDLFQQIMGFQQKCREKINREIPLICIEGNHDNPIYSSKSWMSLLADLGLIILLSGEFDKKEQKIKFALFSEEEKRGGKIRIKDTWIYGLPFYGSYTGKLFPFIYDTLPKNEDTFNILMMHFGIQGYDKRKQGIRQGEDLEKLHEKIDYMALGHYHMKYAHPSGKPWIYNPGSIEIVDIRDLGRDHGIIIAKIDDKSNIQKQINPVATEYGSYDPSLIPNRNYTRPPAIDISDPSSFEDAIEYIINYLRKYGLAEIQSVNDFDKSDLNIPILILNLKGEIEYSRLEINVRRLREEILNKYAVLDVRIYTKEIYSIIDNIKVTDEDLTIDEIEQEVFLSLINSHSDYQENAEHVFNLMEDIKTEMLKSNPNFANLKDIVKGWSILNIKQFSDIEGESADTSEKKQEIETSETEVSSEESENVEDIQEEEIKPKLIHEEFEIDLDDFLDEEEDE